MSAARALAAAPPPVVEGEFPFTQSDFSRIAALLYEQAGITHHLRQGAGRSGYHGGAAGHGLEHRKTETLI